MNKLLIGFLALSLIGCGDGRLFDARGAKGDVGVTGLSGEDGQDGAKGDPGQNAEQLVYLCHVPSKHKNQQHQLYVPQNAVQSHLNHGDYLGSCHY